MQRKTIYPRYFSIPDIAILFLIATFIYGIVSVANAWRAEFTPVSNVDLSAWKLPYYTLLSASRGIVAYLLSLFFTLTVGHWAANSRTAEKVIIPLLDILQSIPVLGFLPGLIIAFVTLFPNSNVGIELAAIVMIFTSQVWNMTFSYYSSLKSIPNEFKESATMMGLSGFPRFFRLELPFSAVNLAWNSLMSMAGGWFFLITCEAFTIGDHPFRLPGIGAYMDVAVKQGNTKAMWMAVCAMVLLIVSMDFVIWRPILAWTKRFRLEELPGLDTHEPLMQIWIRESHILRLLRAFFHQTTVKNLRKGVRKAWTGRRVQRLLKAEGVRETQLFHQARVVWKGRFFIRGTEWITILLIIAGISLCTYRLLLILFQIPPATWILLLQNTFFTFCRVVLSLVLSTLWVVPVGIWVGISPRRTRIAQPIIQILASFPAPMLYPLILTVLFGMGMSFDWASMFLMLFGVQWYVLFNVLAGALRIPKQLSEALDLMDISHWDRWKSLYLPSIFPALVTGWITAAGGAWNASIVAEYLHYQGSILKAPGLGSSLSVATAAENLPLFAASLVLMVMVVVLLNRLVWSRLYRLAQTRYRMDF